MHSDGFLLLLHWVVSAVAILLTSALVPGFKVKGFVTALVAAFIIALANYFLRPILVFLTFPLTILTLGFFLFVVDAIILRLCAGLLKNFEIKGWLSAIGGAIVLMLTSSFLHWFFI